jgi:hypothetical protein
MRRLGDRVELGNQPVIKPGQVLVTMGEQTVVFEQAPQMCDVVATPDRITTPLHLDAAHPRPIAPACRAARRGGAPWDLLQESPNPQINNSFVTRAGAPPTEATPYP